MVARDLSELVERADEASCRIAALTAAAFAVERSGLTDPRAGEALRTAQEGRIGDTAERSAIEALAVALDEFQWDLQDRAAAGTATAEEHLMAFGRARAAAAVFYAGDRDPRVAAAEAIYEASAVADDLDGLRSVVVRALV